MIGKLTTFIGNMILDKDTRQKEQELFKAINELTINDSDRLEKINKLTGKLSKLININKIYENSLSTVSTEIIKKALSLLMKIDDEISNKKNMNTYKRTRNIIDSVIHDLEGKYFKRVEVINLLKEQKPRLLENEENFKFRKLESKKIIKPNIEILKNEIIRRGETKEDAIKHIHQLEKIIKPKIRHGGIKKDVIKRIHQILMKGDCLRDLYEELRLLYVSCYQNYTVAEFEEVFLEVKKNLSKEEKKAIGALREEKRLTEPYNVLWGCTSLQEYVNVCKKKEERGELKAEQEDWERKKADAKNPKPSAINFSSLVCRPQPMSNRQIKKSINQSHNRPRTQEEIVAKVRYETLEAVRKEREEREKVRIIAENINRDIAFRQSCLEDY